MKSPLFFAALITISILNIPPASAENIEWKYFSSYGDEIKRGKNGYALCASPLWNETASESAKNAFAFRSEDFWKRRHKAGYTYPDIPTERDVFICLNRSDVVGVNWTAVEKAGEVETVLKIMQGITTKGLPEVSLLSD